MGRRKHSKIERALPPEIREAVNAKLTEGYTYQEVADWLRDLGHGVSKSAVGRYGKDFLARLERLKVAKHQARAIVQEMGDGPATETEAATLLSVQAIMELRDNLLSEITALNEKIDRISQSVDEINRAIAEIAQGGGGR